jgi:hypothetical protein
MSRSLSSHHHFHETDDRIKLATYSDLLYDDHNMLIQSQWPRQQRDLIKSLSQEVEAVERLVAHSSPFSPTKPRLQNGPAR